MKFPAAVTPPSTPNGCSTRKNFWEEKSTPVNMTSFGRQNVRKHKEIKNIEQFIVLRVSLNLDCMYTMEVTYSESRDYVGRSGKRVTTSLTLNLKKPNQEQKARTSNIAITNQDFREFLKKFKNLPYLGYKKKQVINEPTETYFFLIKDIYKTIKRKKHVMIHTKIVESNAN